MKHTLCFLLLFVCCSLSAQLTFDNSSYFSSARYKNRTDQSFCNFNDLPKTWDGLTLSTWVGLGFSGFVHAYRQPLTILPGTSEWRPGDKATAYEVRKMRDAESFIVIPVRPKRHGFNTDLVEVPLVLSSVFTIGARKQPFKYKIVNLLIGGGIRFLCESITRSTKT